MKAINEEIEKIKKYELSIYLSAVANNLKPYLEFRAKSAYQYNISSDESVKDLMLSNIRHCNEKIKLILGL